MRRLSRRSASSSTRPLRVPLPSPSWPPLLRSSTTLQRLSTGLARIEGFSVVPPAGTFYVFPDVRALCNRLGLTSHGLALYLLEGADDKFGVACLGGECFGA